MAKNKKKKKEKIAYIDDGRTIADMSGVSGGRRKCSSAPPRASFKEQFKTYIAAVKMMLVPMFVTIGILCVAFLIMWLLLR